MPVFFFIDKSLVGLEIQREIYRKLLLALNKEFIRYCGEREKRIWKFRRANVKVLLDDTSIGPR